MFEGIYGFSCVENHVLAQLKSSGTDISRLYGQSAIPVKPLFDTMIKDGIKPEYFYGIPRIQDELKKIGIITLELKKGSFNEIPVDEIVFVKIKPEYAKEKLHTRGLRDDHYVLLKDGSLYNDIPEIAVPADDPDEFYYGEYFVYRQLRELSEDDYVHFAPEEAADNFVTGNIDDIPDIGLRTRNFLWILKTVIYRVNTYFNAEQNARIDNLFAYAEYLNLKKTQDIQQYRNILQEAVNICKAQITNEMN